MKKKKMPRDIAQISKKILDIVTGEDTSPSVDDGKNPHKDTVMKLMVDVGKACMEYQYNHIRDLECERIECDEVWSFCYAKRKNVPDEKKGYLGYGDVLKILSLKNPCTRPCSFTVNRNS